ncbi:MAG: hypothetical protein CL489_06635 [Acidobacteria bacterium]|nr:hypothetical protein [Acidobacteriota bacterium]
MNLDNIIQHEDSSLGIEDITMSAISRKMLKTITPKCMCKSKRGRKMHAILSHNLYFRQFLSGTWIQMNKILGWECLNCYERNEHSRIALIRRGGGTAKPELRTNEGLVINRGRAENIMYEDIGLVPDELKHLIPDDWTEGFGKLLPNPDLPEVVYGE